MCHKKQWMLWIQNHIWKPLPGPQRQQQDAAPSQANWKWTMTLDFLLKFIGFITWLCFSKGHFAHRNPRAGSGCQNLSLSCLATHIDTVTEFQGPGWDPPDRMKGFSSGQWHHDQTSLMAAQFMGNVRDKDLKELRCWQKWCQLFIWGKKTQQTKHDFESAPGISASRDPLPWIKSSLPYLQHRSRGMGWGKADRRPPIPLPTAMGSGCIPAIGLRGAGDRGLPLTGAGNPIFPGQEEAVAPHPC